MKHFKQIFRIAEILQSVHETLVNFIIAIFRGILLTDRTGKIHHYEVVQTEIIPGQDVEAMEFGSAENWDLTLFTCTLSGQSRVTVRAVEQTA